MRVYHAVMSAQPPALGGSPAIAAVDAVIHRALEEQRFDPEGLYFAARLLVRIGECDRAVRVLARIVERGFFAWPAFLRDPWLDPIRRQPAFAAVLRSAKQLSRAAEDEFRRLDDHRLLVW
jgi:hypothetical protein